MKILHILSQRPGLSGSGIFLKAMVREAAQRGYTQHVVAAGPVSTSAEEVPPLRDDQFNGIIFPSSDAPFDVPGNSDVMPYPSTVFSKMTKTQIKQYINHITQVLQNVKIIFKPDIVHTHHLWIMTSQARKVFFDTPIVATEHNVELRLSTKGPHLLKHVYSGIQSLDKICVLTPHSKKRILESYGVQKSKIEITAVGYRDDFFYPSTVSKQKELEELKRKHNISLPDEKFVTFVGRLSTPKGIPYLIQAVKKIKDRLPFKLVLVGAVGSGDDGQKVAAIVKKLGDLVIHLGPVNEDVVASILRCSDLFVLPSLFEGLPLVMLEAVATGCPCVISELPTIKSWVPKKWITSGFFKFVPAMTTVQADIPVESDTERFVNDLASAIEEKLKFKYDYLEKIGFAKMAKSHSWSYVFERYENVYRNIID